MGNYSTNESSVRVDLFKVSGKWYESIAVDMNKYYHEPVLHNALKLALADGDSDGRIWTTTNMDNASFMAVCLHPYHVNGFPILLWVK